MLDHMEMGSFASWASLAVVIALTIERAWSWVGSRKYATRAEIMSTIDLIKDAHHRIDLVEKDVKGLPGYDKVNELIEGIGELKEGQAASRQWQDSTKEELARMHNSIDRIDRAFRVG